MDPLYDNRPPPFLSFPPHPFSDGFDQSIFIHNNSSRPRPVSRCGAFRTYMCHRARTLICDFRYRASRRIDGRLSSGAEKKKKGQRMIRNPSDHHRRETAVSFIDKLTATRRPWFIGTGTPHRLGREKGCQNLTLPFFGIHGRTQNVLSSSRARESFCGRTRPIRANLFQFRRVVNIVAIDANQLGQRAIFDDNDGTAQPAVVVLRTI